MAVTKVHLIRGVQLELRRFACLSGLRQLFRERCAALSLRALPINALERWRFNCKWQEEEASAENAAGDALLPTGPPQRADAAFVTDLCRAGLQPAQAEQLVAGVRAAAAHAAAELAEMAGDAATSSVADTSSSAPMAALVQKRLPGGVRQLQWATGDATSDAGAPSVRVTEATIEKLRALHARHCSGEAEHSTDATASTNATAVNAFDLRLFALLLRYEAIGGAGFQAALGGCVFRELQAALGVNFECFASPLNCYYGAYCSAFPDLDAPFGSRGSFARFSPTRGAYECNPPFVDVIIDACALRMIRLLEKAQAAGEPLAFAVVLPGWADSKGYNALLAAAPLLRRSLLVAAADHGYVDGAQHARRRAYRESTYDTMLFLLQTDAHAAAHPIDDGAMKRLETALAECTPTADGPALPAAADCGTGSASGADVAAAGAAAVSSTSKRDAPACLRAKDSQPRKRRRRGGKGGGRE